MNDQARKLTLRDTIIEVGSTKLRRRDGGRLPDAGDRAAAGSVDQPYRARC